MIEAIEKYEQNTPKSMRLWETFWKVLGKENYQEQNRALIEKSGPPRVVVHSSIVLKQPSVMLWELISAATKMFAN